MGTTKLSEIFFWHGDRHMIQSGVTVASGVLSQIECASSLGISIRTYD